MFIARAMTKGEWREAREALMQLRPSSEVNHNVLKVNRNPHPGEIREYDKEMAMHVGTYDGLRDNIEVGLCIEEEAQRESGSLTITTLTEVVVPTTTQRIWEDIITPSFLGNVDHRVILLEGLNLNLHGFMDENKLWDSSIELADMGNL